MSYSADRVNLAQNLRKMERDSGHSIRSLTRVRKTAYQSAVLVRRILNESMADLILDIKGSYRGHAKPVDAWLTDQFKPFVLLGGDYAEVLRAVENKVPLKRFLALDFVITRHGTAKPKKEKPAPRPAPMEAPAPPPDTTPVKERAVVWEKRATFLDDRVGTLAEQLKAAKARIRELEEENESLRKRLRQLGQ